MDMRDMRIISGRWMRGFEKMKGSGNYEEGGK